MISLDPFSLLTFISFPFLIPDRVFSNDCSTRRVYEDGAKKVALSVASGINCKYSTIYFIFTVFNFIQFLVTSKICIHPSYDYLLSASIFAYGQTSSGKTYTMSGITEYAVADIYDYIDKVFCFIYQ